MRKCPNGKISVKDKRGYSYCRRDIGKKGNLGSWDKSPESTLGGAGFCSAPMPVQKKRIRDTPNKSCKSIISALARLGPRGAYGKHFKNVSGCNAKRINALQKFARNLYCEG